MLFLVCFQCFEVFASGEGHSCTDTEGNACETDPANVLLVHAMPLNPAENATIPLSERSSSSTRSGYRFSVVTSRSGSKTTDIKSQARKTDATLRTSDISLYQHNPIPTTCQDVLVPPEQAASNLNINPEPRNLRVEIPQSTHPKKKCNICGKKYTQEFSHGSEKICVVCGKMFQCRTQYNEHLLDHPDYFLKRCWVCSKDINDHYSKHDNLYKCCSCEFQNHRRYALKNHSTFHRPGLLCKVCGEEYDIEDQQFHYGSFPCRVCMEPERKFPCQRLLEDHCRENHLNYLLKNCILCQRVFHKPVTEHKDNAVYKCCQCPFESSSTFFPYHLLNHTGLRLFYCCDKCGRRFSNSGDQISHEQYCKPLPFKCEMCRSSFDSEVSLLEHHLKYHAPTLRLSVQY